MPSISLLKLSTIGLAGFLCCAPALAETSIDTPERFSILVTYGDDACPEAQADEIVVCAQRPESERYRIPKELRELEKAEEAGRAKLDLRRRLA